MATFLIYILGLAISALALLTPIPAPPAPVTPTALAVVDNLQVIYSKDGCVDWQWAAGQSRYCHPWWDLVPAGSQFRVDGYYIAPIRTIVLRPGAAAFVLRHERCHAHQHLTVLQELGREPDADLSDWLLTTEGRQSGLSVEDWALTCE